MVECKKRKQAIETIVLKLYWYTEREVIITLDTVIMNATTPVDEIL
jgi:hypothetical protein